MTTTGKSAGELRAMAARLSEMADALDGQLASAETANSAAAFLPHYRLAMAAENALAERVLRQSIGIPDLLGEPAWDMLLFLFTQSTNKSGSLTKAACYAAGVPQTTGLRYLSALEAVGMIERSTGKDSRCTVLRLTAVGRQRMSHYLDEIHVFRKNTDITATGGRPFSKLG